MNNYIVYMHVNRINGKKYIGITSLRPKARWHNGHGYKKQKRFWSAIVCYGWENFEHLVLFEGLTKEDAEAKEEELIKKYKSNDLAYGYNIENGGVTHKLSKEQKDYLRDINIGKRHSEETKRKMSESHKGMSTLWLTGRIASDETKEKMSKSRMGSRNPRAKKVYQYDLAGNLISEYEYMKKAVESLGLKGSAHISQCCAGKRKTAHGYMWSYEKLTPCAKLQGGGC